MWVCEEMCLEMWIMYWCMVGSSVPWPQRIPCSETPEHDECSGQVRKEIYRQLSRRNGRAEERMREKVYRNNQISLNFHWFFSLLIKTGKNCRASLRTRFLLWFWFYNLSIKLHIYVVDIQLYIVRLCCIKCRNRCVPHCCGICPVVEQSRAEWW